MHRRPPAISTSADVRDSFSCSPYFFRHRLPGEIREGESTEEKLATKYRYTCKKTNRNKTVKSATAKLPNSYR